MSEIFAQLLRKREFGQDFLCPKYEETIRPELMPDLKKAVERLGEAREKHEKVLIYGDYDVDGVTASTVAAEMLERAGVQVVEIMLPNRFTDGYGMSGKVVARAKELGVGLVLTVDCGSRNHEIIEQLRAEGIETIVTDHHECGATLPEETLVLNPKRRDALQAVTEAKGEELTDQEVDELLELRELAGVGVVFKLAQGLVQKGLIPEGQEKWLLDLVLIGTVCDSMKLLGENRRLCFYGLKVLEKTRRPGLKELMRLSGVKRLNSDAIGFQIGPRLNAAGRMETAEKALELLRAKTRIKAAELAAELEFLNQQRKKQQNEAVDEIRRRGVGEQKVIVERGDWHEGVLGIIAGRLTEEYHRPAFALAECDGILKGSGRSFGDFNLAEALTVCEKYIIGGGGHAEACGVKLELERFEDFCEALEEYCQSLRLEDQERFFAAREDLKIEKVEELSLELIDELKKLEPYGPGNGEPVFLLKNARVVEVAKLGEGDRHLRLVVWDQTGKSLKLMNFSAPKEYLALSGGEIVDVWFTLCENEFRGIRSVEGRVVRIG